MKRPLDVLEIIRATDGRAELESVARELALEQAAAVEYSGAGVDRDEFVESVRDLVQSRLNGEPMQRHLDFSDPRAHEPFDVTNLALSRKFRAEVSGIIGQ